MRHFDYESMARAARMPPAELARLRALVRREFPEDDMMFELHMLRVCMAVRDGRLSIDEALVEEKEAAA